MLIAMAVTVAVIPILAVVLMRWLPVSLSITAVTFIVNSMSPPIRMAAFPSLEALDTPRLTTQPDIARSEIEIGATHNADVFVAVPIVIVRIHPHCHHGRGRHHRHATVRADHATGHQCRGRQTTNTQRYFINAFHAD